MASIGTATITPKFDAEAFVDSLIPEIKAAVARGLREWADELAPEKDTPVPVDSPRYQYVQHRYSSGAVDEGILDTETGRWANYYEVSTNADTARLDEADVRSAVDSYNAGTATDGENWEPFPPTE